MSKACTWCMQEKTEVHFSRQAGGRGGLRARCRDCESRIAKLWYWKNREQTLKRQKDYNKKKRTTVRMILRANGEIVCQK